MLRRSAQSRFVAGAHVFPGGAVDPGDARPDLAAPQSFDHPDEGSAYRVAAIRECFEEAGILLVEREGGDLLERPDSALAARLLTHRAHLIEAEGDFLDVCAREALTPAVSRLRYLSRWITPEGLPRRYDTRFFVAIAPDGQVAEACARETFDASWFRPGDALDAFRRKEIDLVLPTVRTLEGLTGHPDVEAAFETVSEVGDSRS